MVATIGRSNKITQAYKKAMESCINKCSLDKIQQAFPTVLSEGTSCYILGPQSEEMNVNILAYAHTKCLEYFQHEMDTKWEQLLEEYNLTEKLKLLDDILLSNTSMDRSVLESLFLCDERPHAHFLKAKAHGMQKEIQSMQDELEMINEENSSLVSAILNKRNGMINTQAQLNKSQNDWNPL